MSQSYNASRLHAMSLINHRTPQVFEKLYAENGVEMKVSDYFGANTFNKAAMKKYLSEKDFATITHVLDQHLKITQDHAEILAKGLLAWALENGATHYCHWFQPQTGKTAEKHDSFTTWVKDDFIEQFKSSALLQSEPDASSFPSGGLRNTFEARGYTVWDPFSPVFLMDSPNGRTMCIPSCFISYTGESLDVKTPFLKSESYLNKQVNALFKNIGAKEGLIKCYVGPEQEYFLIDTAFYNQRPDLLLTGRALVGSEALRGQEMEDHYFGSIPGRVLAFQQEMEFELNKLGVPVKTRHNEVAPSQYETAPMYEEANRAIDHNHLIMEIMTKVANNHDFTCLLHEKPFAGINGSGKHVNWSIAAADGENLLEPGTTPFSNVRFLATLSSVLLGLHEYNGLLRAAIATPGNDFRLGANEAPPAIISAYLGESLNNVLNAIANGDSNFANTEKTLIELGVSKLPKIQKDTTDRNRTSPFAFTGNKFEFRAVGSSASIGVAVCYLNLAVGQGFKLLNEKVQSFMSKGMKGEQALMNAIKEAIIQSKNVRFEGNGYSEEWVKEAKKRGLENLRTCPEGLKYITRPEVKKIFEESEIFSAAEIDARYETQLHNYTKTRKIELEVLLQMINTQIVPAGFEYQQSLCDSVNALLDTKTKFAGVELGHQGDVLKNFNHALNSVIDGKNKLLAIQKDIFETEKDHVKQGDRIANEIVPLMEEVRLKTGEMESLMGDQYWPLPKMTEMLFVK